MGTLVYVRLIGYTAGTLLMLFWMVVILGYRRQRNFERVFFFFCLALFLFYGGSLLALNAQLYYPEPPPALETFSQFLLVLALWTLPALLLHLHVEYAKERGQIQSGGVRFCCITICYLPFLLMALQTRRTVPQLPFDFQTPINTLGTAYKLWLFAALLIAAVWQRRFFQAATVVAERHFHQAAALWLAVGALLVFDVHLRSASADRAVLVTILAFLPLLPLGVLVYYVEKHNFLQIGRQRNLVYAVVITFLALLYLSVIRRISSWLEPVLPPEATAAVLIFVLVAFFEPLQRIASRVLRATAHGEIDRAHKTISAIQQVARLGDPAKLLRFVETWVAEQLGLAAIKLCTFDSDRGPESPASTGDENRFAIRQAGRSIGFLDVRTHGAMLSGETRAALEFLCTQLPAAIDLCRAIEEKVRLERELAERERLAALGQMAASISHNLKNPLGSIKTILQVQLENPQMPDSLKSETQMVLAEVSRLSNKLAQLLQFSRPAVLGEANSSCNAAEIVKEVTEVLRHEAVRKGIRLQVSSNGNLPVAIGKEALSDILSNLIVNALEAAPTTGKVSVTATKEEERALIRIEDEGKGIPPDLRQKVLQPFFTTKTQGTGLGLAIVAKRVAESDGALELESPIADGRGTRFSVWLPMREEGK
jgi:signal transduction histidine kinase